MADTVRQRKPQVAAEEPTKPSELAAKPNKKVDDEDAYSPFVDILRVITFIFVVSCGLSYLISGGETWFWGMKDPPNYLQTEWWKSQFVSPATSLALRMSV